MLQGDGMTMYAEVFDGKIGLYKQSLLMWYEKGNLVGLSVIHLDGFEYCCSGMIFLTKLSDCSKSVRNKREPWL